MGYLLVAEVLFIGSADLILAMICHLFELYFDSLSYLWDDFNTFCFMCLLRVFLTLAANQISFQDSKVQVEVGGSRQIGIRETGRIF